MILKIYNIQEKSKNILQEHYQTLCETKWFKCKWINQAVLFKLVTLDTFWTNVNDYSEEIKIEHQKYTKL